MGDFVLTEFLYHIVSGCLILCFIFLFIWKAKHISFPKEKTEFEMLLEIEKLKPQKKRVLGFPGKLF